MLRRIGLSSCLALSSASAPHGYQSTGFSACWSRYGLVSSARRFAIAGGGGHVRTPLVRLVWTVHDHVDPLQRDQAAADHRVELGKNRVDPLLRFYALDHNRQVERQLEELGRMNPATCAKGHDATRDCRAGIVALAQELHDRPVQRLTLELVALADVDPHQYPLTLQAVHFSSPL